MPQTKHISRISVGLFVVLGLGLIGWMILQFGEFRGSARGGYPLVVQVKDATGIRPGVPVRLGGVGIGRVAGEPSLNPDFTSLTILLEIQRGIRIPTGSTAKIATSGLMGDSFVRIVPPEKPSAEFLSEGAVMIAESAETLDELAGNAEEAI